MNANIVISGNIISELSEKIPSNIIALNELIKNSYDAGAKIVTIRLDSVHKKLSIIDNGVGMNKEDIDTLFHISDSKKEYGKKNIHGRYTQGSKGLGFLSVFKFGKHVTWKTRKVKGLKFSVDYMNLLERNDISDYRVEITEDQSIAKGTHIDIDIDDYNLQYLKDYFSKEKNYEKVINAFLDSNFIIELEIDEKKYSNKNTKQITDYLKECQLYNVKYDSEKEIIEYYYNNILILSKNYEFNHSDFELKIDLVIFKLQRGGKKKISQLFYNPMDDLTPLIYINSNLFNNYNIFDPNVMKNIRSGESLNQMIGHIKLISSDYRINFNSDRTHFLQNHLTDDIIKFLNDINITIHKFGAKHRKYLVDLDFLSDNKISRKCVTSGTECLKDMIKDTFSFKENVTIQVKATKVVYSVFGKQVSINIMENKQTGRNNDNENNTKKDNNKKDDNDEKNDDSIIPAVIELKNKHLRYSIPSNQINLYENIKKASDSNGNKIDNTNIQLKVNNVIVSNNILQSINKPCSMIIEYSFLDSNTGLVMESIEIEFFQPKSKLGYRKDGELLITLPTNKDYIITFNSVVGELISQINELKLSEFKQVLACSIRSVFEISVDSIKKSGKFVDIFKNINVLEDRVAKTINYISSNRQYISEISKATDIDYNSLNNSLKQEDFKNAIGKAHLGAHKSTTYISEIEIQHLGGKAAMFITIVNEMINNGEII